jgi:hypothetical protein
LYLAKHSAMRWSVRRLEKLTAHGGEYLFTGSD